MIICSLIFLSPTCLKAKFLEKMSIYSNKFFHSFHLSESSFSCSVTLPKIIGPERNVNLICNSSLYTHITKIKSISPSLKKKVVTTKYLAKFQSKGHNSDKNHWTGTKRKIDL
jgi:hypothetical protein